MKKAFDIKNTRVSDMLLVSDLDGTIVPASRDISQKNIDAVKRFQSLGGSFSVATGRMADHAKYHAEAIGVDGAMIVSNGMEIYDISCGKKLWQQYFSDTAKDFLIDFIKKFPDVAVVCNDEDYNRIIINSTAKFEEFIKKSGIGEWYTRAEKLELPEKFVCGTAHFDNEAELKDALLYLVNSENDDLQFMLSGDMWIDILPSGVSKGMPFEKLAEIYGKKMENTVAIGDYNNDITMIEKAALGVAVANAQQAVKDVAQMTVASCEDSGLAELIDYLIENSLKD